MRFALLLAVTLTALEAQTIEVRSFSHLAPLDGNWKFTTSDDPRFAAPGLRRLGLAHDPRARRGDPP